MIYKNKKAPFVETEVVSQLQKNLSSGLNQNLYI